MFLRAKRTAAVFGRDSALEESILDTIAVYLSS